MSKYKFYERHIGPKNSDIEKMLKVIGVQSIDQLIDETIPQKIRLDKELNLPEGMSENQYYNYIRNIAKKNKLYRSFIGMGYYNTHTPSVILRNIFENPGWYTAYTPYQAEISQGRLEALLNFQTMICDLTKLPIANASLLDEATAAAEAMLMMYNMRSREAVKRNAKKLFVSRRIFPQTLDVILLRAEPFDIEVVVGCHDNIELNENFFGAIIQYPAENGAIYDYTEFMQKAKANGIFVSVAADLMSLAILTPPGEWGADIVFGNTQRFGIPMGFGGPHAAYFATKDEYKRYIPGRIIGVSIDNQGKPALRMALQTREQHIKREKATSNICTSQVLLAVMAGMYAVYHGKEGIKHIAEKIHIKAALVAKEAEKLGYKQKYKHFFDTLYLELPDNVDIQTIRKNAEKKLINLRYIDNKTVGLSTDECFTIDDANDILEILAESAGKQFNKVTCGGNCKVELPDKFLRKSDFLTHPVFNTYHSETEMMRYLKKLENKDLALNRTMIPLGSCTMKLNAAIEMLPLSWPEFTNIHPFVPEEQAEGYKQIIKELGDALCEITGFPGITFMPNSGAQGEYTGLMVIRAYHKSKGEDQRNVALIPSSAHGTNPASAIMAGMEVVVVKCDNYGNIDLADLKMKAEQYKDRLSCLMITYPSTHGVFEEDVLEIIQTVHQYGGQVYMDGANMNAQVGYTNPARIGADVCHLNLHKTFAIPHGGGGPGAGPICVASHLVPFLPGHPIVKTGGEKAIHAVSAAPYGSALILIISHAYIKLMGGKGLKEATKFAILNANYIKSALENDYKILYTGSKGRCAHEMIIDCNIYSKTAEVTVIDIAKRLMDYGFHAPTVAFPVHGTLMIEPTESEPLSELDRFIEAMKLIRKEIAEIEQGKAPKGNNVIVNAPHTCEMVVSSSWDKPYTREQAAFPVNYLKQEKYWPSVGKINDAYGDRNLVCSCYFDNVN